MPNIAKIYSDAIRLPVDEKAVTEPQMDATKWQMHQAWKSSTVTKEKIALYESEIAKLLDQAIDLACSFPAHQHPHKIIHNLVLVKQLKNIIEDYGK